MKDSEQKVIQWLEDNQQKLYTVMSKILQIESQNFESHGNEENCAPYLLEQFSRLGLQAEKYYPDDVPGIMETGDFLPGRGTDKRPNVSGTFFAPGATETLMIASHTDTMPIGDRNAWKHDPLGGEDCDGKIFGRGACDDKFGLATSILAYEAIRDCGLTLDKNLVINAYCDEEYGGGNGALAASVKHRPTAILNTDGGHYEVWTWAMGGQMLSLYPQSRTSEDSGKKMLEVCHRIMKHLDGFVQNRQEELGANPYYKGTEFQKSACRVTDIHIGNDGCNMDKGLFSFVYYTTMTQGNIQVELDKLHDAIQADVEELGVDIGPFVPGCRYFYCLSIPDDDPFVQLVKGCAEDAAGREVKISGASMSDLSLFFKHGSPTSLNFGVLRDFSLPGGAHQNDEFVDKQELLNHAKTLALTMLRWCGYHKN